MLKKIILVVLCFSLLTGCWNKIELNELGIVLAVAVDKDSNSQKFRVTLQIVRPNALRKEGYSGASPIEIVSSSGETIFDAIKNISKQLDRRSYFAHNKILIIDEKLAREGIKPIIDFFMRTHESRKLMWIVIAKNSKAMDILGVSHGVGQIQATQLSDIIKFRKLQSESDVSNLLEFIKRSSTTGINPYTGVVEIYEQPFLPNKNNINTTNKILNLSGIAVFNKERLIGFLDNEEAKSFNWIIGEVKEGRLKIVLPDLQKEQLTIQIKKATSQIIPQYNNNKISFTIKIKCEGVLIEQYDELKINEIDVFDKVKENMKKAVKEEARIALVKIQEEYRSDIVGFGKAFSKKYPSVWSKIEKDWDNIFPKTEYTIDIDANIENLGAIQKPIESKY